VVDDLNSREATSYVHTVLREGTSADRQLAVFRETGDLKAVVQFVVQETKAGVDRSADHNA
jgi:glutamate---cysteine ligase / carboxylate-amine ligase